MNSFKDDWEEMARIRLEALANEIADVEYNNAKDEIELRFTDKKDISLILALQRESMKYAYELGKSDTLAFLRGSLF